MSYTLCLWDPSRPGTLPTTHRDADTICERLSAVSDRPTAKMIALVSALVTVAETRPTEEQARVGLEAYWGADPRVSLRANETAVFRLRIPSDDCIAQIAAVVSAGAKLGLVVYDDENGMCFLPDGTIFPESMREGWAFDLEELRAGPPDPHAPDGRTWLQRLAGELFDALGQGNRRS